MIIKSDGEQVVVDGVHMSVFDAVQLMDRIGADFRGAIAAAQRAGRAADLAERQREWEVKREAQGWVLDGDSAWELHPGHAPILRLYPGLSRSQSSAGDLPPGIPLRSYTGKVAHRPDRDTGRCKCGWYADNMAVVALESDPPCKAYR